MSGKEDPGSGVKCFSIAGRMIHIRERCFGMTDEERRWRNQWLKDQVLHEEAKFVPEYYKDTTNIFRRIISTPMMKFEQMLKPHLGTNGASYFRFFVGKTTLGILAVYIAYYNYKYKGDDWTKRRSFEFAYKRAKMLPGDPGYPHMEERTPQSYADYGFSKSFYHKN